MLYLQLLISGGFYSNAEKQRSTGFWQSLFEAFWAEVRVGSIVTLLTGASVLAPFLLSERGLRGALGELQRPVPLLWPVLGVFMFVSPCFRCIRTSSPSETTKWTFRRSSSALPTKQISLVFLPDSILQNLQKHPKTRNKHHILHNKHRKHTHTQYISTTKRHTDTKPQNDTQTQGHQKSKTQNQWKSSRKPEKIIRKH